ncbi:PAS domain S-box protein [Flexithrix dorotheae]|uniref:PAS domain-containing sensor histidine kinase n=1 Tax=Flexithrix dorotheae TaxID=70993 RepID=UPI00035D73B9|nr:PAS domain S-box protein [Flexithrix dorotheae]
MSKAALTDIINSFKQTFFQLNTEGRFTFIEHQNTFIPESCLDQTIFPFISAHQRAFFKDQFLEFVKDLKPLELQIDLVFSKQFSVILALMPIIHQDNKVINGRLTLIDKGQNKPNVDLQLKENEERLRLAFESSNDGIWDWNLETDEVYYSKRWKSILGFEEDEVVHHIDGFNQLVHPEDKALTYERVNEFIEKKRDKYEVKFRMRHKNGEYRHILSKAIIIRNPDTDKAVRLVGIHEDVTERILAKETLSQREENYKFLVENIDLPISQYDRAGNILFFNRQAGIRMGGKPEDFIGKNLRDLFPEKKADFYIRKINEVLDKGTIDTREEYFQLSVHNPYWYQTTSVPIINSENQGDSILVISHDVTELRESARQKKMLQMVLDTAFEYSPVGLIIADVHDGEIHKINKAALNFFDESPETFKSLKIEKYGEKWKCLNPDGSKINEDELPFSKTINNGEVVKNQELIIETKNGKREWLIVNSSPIRDLENKIIGGILIFSSITHQKVAGDLLKKSEENYKKIAEDLNRKRALLRSLIDSVPDLIFYKNQESQYLGCNIAYEKYLGKKESEIIDKTDLEFFDHTEADQFHKNDEEILKKRIPQRMEQFITYPDGRKVLLDVLKTPYFGPDGETLGLIGICRDITEIKKAQEEINNHNLELTKTNKELDNFVYSVSHDLRAPITSALGLIEITKAEDDIEQIREFLALQEKGLHKMDNFIKDILDYSRNTRLEVKSEKINIQELVEDTFSPYAYIDEYKGIKAISQFNLNAELYSDLNRISVILNNLVSNAFRFFNKFEENPYVKITVNCQKEKAEIIVEDNGQGIGEDHLEKVFNMFYRASENKPGSGLGLYIVKEAVEKLKGSIQVESSLGKCTKFTLSIPNLKK